MTRQWTIKVIFGALAVGLLLLSACDRHIESRYPVRSLPEAPAAPTDLLAVINIQSITLSWQASGSAGVDRYRVYRSTDDGPFSVVDSTSANTIEITGLSVGTGYHFQAAAVTVGGVEGYRSETVSVRLGVLGISIDGGRKYTPDKSVQIQLTTGVPTTYVALSESPSFTDSVLLPYSGQVPFELSGGDGLKTVYARFTFQDGLRSGELITDDIILDTRARIDSVIFMPDDSVFSPGDTIRFFIDAAEVDGQADVSFGPVTRMTLYNDGQDADATAGDSIFSGWYVVPENVTLTDGTVTGSFRDEAGNPEVSLVADNRLSIRSSLLPVELVLVEPKSSFEMDLLWTEAAIADFHSYRVYRGQGTAATADSTLVSTITTRSQTSFVDTALNDNTQYSYVIYLRDQLGRDTASNTASASTEVNQDPQAVTLAGSLDTDGATAILSWSVNPDADFESYRIFRANVSNVSESDQMVGYISNRNSTSFSDYIPASMNNAWYRVYVYDRHGASTGSNIIAITK